VSINPRGLSSLRKRALALFAPPPRLSVSEWAAAFAYIPKEGNAEPGRFRIDRLAYQRAMLDDVLDPTVSETVWMVASQLCKTASLVLITEFFIHQQPASILAVYPTLASAEAFTKEKLMTSIRETPCMKGLIKDSRSRDSENTMLNKRFPGGNLTVCGSNSPSGLRQRSKRIILKDEIDAYEDNKEGDPCDLADRAAMTFHDAVKLSSSTPTIRGMSRIEKLFETSDKQRFFCACHKCGHQQTLKWACVKWPSEDRTAEAYYECEQCQAPWTDAQRIAAIDAGEWRATAPFRGVRGRHLNGIYRVMGKKKAYASYLHEFVENFLKAKRKGKHALQTWVNIFLAETYESTGDRVESDELMKRIESYTELPASALCITAGFDVQLDRVECEVVAWGAGEESWGVKYLVIPGRYDDAETWRQVSTALNLSFRRADGVSLPISAAIVDSGAFQKHVLKFTKPLFPRRVLAGKGSNIAGSPILGVVSRANSEKAAQLRIGTDTAKGVIMGRLALTEPGPGYMHFTNAKGSGFDSGFFLMLTAEERRVKLKRGHARDEWHKIEGRRNEALDCRVYAMAALYYLNPNFAALEKNLAKRAGKTLLFERSDIVCPTEGQQPRGDAEASQPSQEPAPLPKPTPPRRPVMRRNFVSGRGYGGQY
jgi:phage terminase large subunit GpA-like protein